VSNTKEALVIIPAYNEEQDIAEIITQICRHSHMVDILVVNDGSGDRTSRIAHDNGAMVIDLSFNMGYGVALQTGYKYALNAGYQYVVQIDADGQHDPKYISALLDEVKKGGVDVVIGSRFLTGGSYKVPVVRQLGMQLFNLIASLITRQKITDCTSGYQVINRDVLNFYSTDIYPCDYPDVDILIMLYFSGFKMKEVSTTMFQNKSGKSMHRGIRPLYYMFKMLLSIFVILLREKPYKKRRRIC